MSFRALAVCLLISAGSAMADTDFYFDEARTTGPLGPTKDLVEITIKDGGSVSGEIYSLYFDERLTFKGRVNSAGRLHAVIKGRNGIRGRLNGKVTDDGVIAEGSANSKRLGSGRFKISAEEVLQKSYDDIRGRFGGPNDSDTAWLMGEIYGSTRESKVFIRLNIRNVYTGSQFGLSLTMPRPENWAKSFDVDPIAYRTWTSTNQYAQGKMSFKFSFKKRESTGDIDNYHYEMLTIQDVGFPIEYKSSLIITIEN
jgi:hypothetical protein